MRRHPNQTTWNRPYLCDIAVAQPTSFEQLVRELNLHPADYASSAELKQWVRQNKDQKFVPLDVLKIWGFTVRAEI
jgi:hypothetical protein